MPVGVAIGTAAVAGGSAYLSGKQNSKAINKATDAQSASNAQAVAAQREARNQNVQLQQPFYNTGTAAMGQMNALLGLNVPATGGGAMGGAMDEQWANGALQAMGLGSRGDSVSTLRGHLEGQIEGPISDQMRSAYDNYQRMTPMTVAAQPGQNPQSAAEAAYNQFKTYTGYKERLAEGNNALNAGYAAGGTLQSGDALKGFARFNQDFASNEFGQYANLLGGQQQLGAGAANALSGVHTNYANAASNLAIQNGQNIANGAYQRANNTNSMIYGISNALIGGMNGMGGGSSYRPGG